MEHNPLAVDDVFVLIEDGELPHNGSDLKVLRAFKTGDMPSLKRKAACRVP